jgi:hypothetical protein
VERTLQADGQAGIANEARGGLVGVRPSMKVGKRGWNRRGD